jgi:shikimate kinase / 3-dehydroquinate synthase
VQRPLLLSGFMASGKTTVGRLLAEREKRPFIDLDQAIEARLGASVKELFARFGEAGFRAEERRELTKLLEPSSSGPAPIVALGGGALLARDLRLLALDRAVVVSLEASAKETARRAGSGSSRPNLASGDVEQRATDLLSERALVYAEAHARIATDGLVPETIADRVLAIWKRDPIAVAAGAHSYSVEVGHDLVATRLPALAGMPSLALLVTDENVGPLHAGGVKTALGALVRAGTDVVLPAGERHKHIGSVERIWRGLLSAGADRKSALVGLGGGVVTDMTGFAAASYMRGIRWVGVPTTLLAMVDASVGGKTGVDLEQAKNAVGAFWQPSAVLLDTALEATEPDRGYTSALAEVVKTALIGDPALLELLEAELPAVRARSPELVAEMVRRSVRVKARVVGLDEREGDQRALLNLGHTLGHALESQAGFERLMHGEAVSLGLVAALRIGEALGETPKSLTERTVRLLAAVGLPVDLTREPLAEAAKLVGLDKKRNGSSIRFVLARAPGSVVLRDMPLGDLERLAQALT